MARRRVTSGEERPARDPRVAQERRARAQRDRDRERAEREAQGPARVTAAKPVRAKSSRPAAASSAQVTGMPARKRRVAAGGSSPSVVQVQREGLVGWAVRIVRGFPQLVGQALLGFLHEVGAVFRGMGRGALRMVPGGSLLVRSPARQPVLGGGPATTARPGVGGGVTDGDRRADVRRRRLLLRRLRLAAVVLAGVMVVVGSWVVPRADMFRVRHVEVLGASAVGDLEVRQRIDGMLEDRTIFTADTDAIARRIEELPFVRQVDVERHVPGGLGIRISEYRPLAVACGSKRCWLVAPDGRILTKVDGAEWQGRVPIVRLATDRVRPGMRLPNEPGLALLLAVPKASILSFASVDATPYSVVATTTEGDIEVRFGRAELWATKLAVAQRIIQDARVKGRQLAYVDVSVPDHFAVCEVRSSCEGVATPTEVAAVQAAKAEAAMRAAELRAGGATEEEIARDAAGNAASRSGATAATAVGEPTAGEASTGDPGSVAGAASAGATAGTTDAAPKDAFEAASTTR